MSSTKQPTWQFPPSGGGNVYVEDPAISHFRENPLDKFVREILQNSTDARDHNFPTVHISFTETMHRTADILADDLIPHIEASVAIAEAEGKPKLRQRYERAISALKKRRIRCLDVTDSNTTGLLPPNWDALIYKAGSNQKGDNPAAGGTHGIGKYASFNISAARTVFYYTCIQQGRGRTAQRIERWAGKSLLSTHHIGQREVQHTGFFRHEDHSPITGREIPEEFRTPRPSAQPNTPPCGTTVSIIGFAPNVRDWPNTIARSTITNFFEALRNQSLVVTIQPMEGPAITITKDNLDHLFNEYIELHPRNRSLGDAYHYYQAGRPGQPSKTIPLGEPFNGEIQASVITGQGRRRSAYINYNGMFITDAREQKRNPLRVAIPSHYPELAIAVKPTTPATNAAISQLENVAHDEIQISTIEDPAQRRQAREALLSCQQQIKEFVSGLIEKDAEAQSQNITELADALPEQEPAQQLQMDFEITTKPTRAQTSEVDGEPEDGGEESPNHPPDGKKGGDTGQPERGRRTNPRESSRRRPTAINKFRFIPSAERNGTMLFTTRSPQRKVVLALTRCGEISSMTEPKITISSANEQGGAPTVIENGNVSITAEEPRRYAVTITTEQPINDTAISVRSI